MSKWSDDINHPGYANDTIIFVSTEKKSLDLAMKRLGLYKKQFGR